MDESRAPERRFFVEVDGQRYGPATVAILQEWVTAGRVTPDSILIEEGTGAELHASAVEGLAWNAASGMTPPAPDGHSYPPRKSTNVWLIVVAGCGAVSCFGCIILAAILFPVFSQARKAAQRAVEVSNVKQIDLCLLLYADDYDGDLPPTMDSAAALKPYLLPYTKLDQTGPAHPAIFDTPPASGGQILGNKALAGKSTFALQDPRKTVLIYDNAPILGGQIVGYADGTVQKKVLPSQLQKELSENVFMKSH